MFYWFRFAHGPQDLQAFSAKVAEKGKSKSSGHRNKRKNKCFSRSSVLFNNKVGGCRGFK